MGDTSAGPIFHRDSQNEVKNPPGGQRCWRVIKNRCLFPLSLADSCTGGCDLSHSGSSVCPSFVPPMFCFCLSSVTAHFSPLPPRLNAMQQPAPHLLTSHFFFFSPQMTTLHRITGQRNHLYPACQAQISPPALSLSLSLYVPFVSACGSIFLCLHLQGLQSELSFKTASIHYGHD